MKKFLALLMTVAMLCGCTAMAETEDPNLAAAKNFLFMMYNSTLQAAAGDYELTSVANIAGNAYTVTWTTDSDTIVITDNGDNTVTVDVDTNNPEDLPYTLTGTIASESGASIDVTFNLVVPHALVVAGMSYEEIVEAAYTLEDGAVTPVAQRLFGTVTEITDAYSEKYDNITVVIQIGELADKPITCYRLGGEGVADLKVGDEITVEGIMTNYKGTIEFDAGSQLVGFGEIKDQSPILDGAYQLEDGASLPEAVTLTGVVSEITDAYSEKYGNITVIMICDGKTEQPIMCYRLAGEGADTLAVGDTITVTGTMTNYKGTIEFAQGCTIDALTKAE